MPKPNMGWLIRIIFVVSCLLAFNTFVILAQDETPPTETSTEVPTEVPTDIPTDIPTEVPTEVPTDVPTDTPTDIPTEVPTAAETETVAAPTETPPSPEATVDLNNDTVTAEPTLVPTQAPVTELPAEPIMNLLVRETFDNGDLSPWDAVGWTLIGDANDFVMAVSNSNTPARLLKGQFANVAVQAKFQVTTGSAQLNVRQSAVGSYTASIDTLGNVQLIRAGEVLGEAVAPPAAADGWRTLRLSAVDTVIRVSVDGVELIALQDAFLMPPGDVSMSADFPTNADGTVTGTLLADNFFLWVPQDEYGLYPPPTPVPQVEIIETPTVESTPVPTVELPTAEPVIETTPEATTEVTPEATTEALTVEPVIETTPEVTLEATTEVTPEATVESTLEVTPEVTPEATVEATAAELAPLTSSLSPPSAAQLAAAQDAGNNTFASSTPIVSDYPANQATGDTTAADLEPDDNNPTEIRPAGCGINVGKTVWYDFVPLTGGNYTFSLAGSDFDTVLAVYTDVDPNNPPTDPTPANLNQIACNDDASARVFTSILTLNGLVAGSTYHIQIGGFQHSYGTYFISVQQVGLRGPGTPVLISPASNAVSANQTPDFAWSIPAYATHYEFQISTSSRFSTLAINPAPTVGTGAITPSSNLNPGVYYWRVRAINNNGVYGRYSGARRIIINPAAPNPASPGEGATVATLRPIFGVTTFAKGATYFIQLSDTDDFASNLFPHTFSSTSTKVPATFPLHQGTWHWRVGAEDSSHVATTDPAYSPSRTIIINLQRSPGNNAVYFTASTANVTFMWYTSIDAATYQVEIMDAADPGTVINQCPSVPAATSICTIPGLAQGNYLWRVVSDLDTDPLLVPTRSFTVSPPLSPAPGLLSPGTNATTADQTPTLSWTSVTGAFSYNIQVCSVANCSPRGFVENGTSATTTYDITTTLTPGRSYYWRVQTVNSFHVAGPFSRALRFIIRTAPPILRAPGYESTNPNLTPTLIWLAYPGATYDLEIDTQFDFGSGSKMVENGLTTPYFTLPTLGDQDTYYWHVRAIDGTAFPGTTEFSPTWQFTVAPFGLPVAPPLISPYNGATVPNLTPTLTWGTPSNPTGAPFTYELQYATNSRFNQNLVTKKDIATTDYTFGSADLEDGRTYYWRVRTVNSAGVPGRFSAVRRFTIRMTGPALRTPGDGAVTANARQPLSWLGFPSATLYNIRIDTDSACDSSIGTFTSTRTIFTPPVSLPQDTYYWCVQAQDAQGNTSDFSAPRTLIVNIQTLPGNNAVYVTASTATIPFRWAGVPGFTDYKLQIDDDPNFGSPEALIPPTTTTTIQVVSGLGYGTWYWRVIVTGNDNEAPFPAEIQRSFIVSPPLPGAPVPTSPPNNAVIWTTTPTLTWTVPAGTGTPFTYDLLICRDPRCRSIVPTPPDLPIPSYDASLSNGAYYWQVRATNSPGAKGRFSRLQRFTISSPPVVTLRAPGNNSTTTASQPTFLWFRPLGAVKYDIQLYNAPLIDDTNPVAPVQVFTTSYRPIAPEINDTYYWRVRAYDAVGTQSAWSVPWTVKITTAASGAPLPNRFGPDNPAGYDVPKLTWGPISWTNPVGGGDPGWYEVQVDDSYNFTLPLLVETPHDASILPSGTQSFAEGTGTFYQLPNGVYYWHVRACDSSGHCGAWSSTGSFSVDR
jgi:hypothetical protein